MSLRRRKKEEFRDTWHVRDSACCTFNRRDTDTSSTQASLSCDGRLCFTDVIYDGRSVLTRLTPYKGPSSQGIPQFKCHTDLWEDIRWCHQEQEEG